MEDEPGTKHQSLTGHHPLNQSKSKMASFISLIAFFCCLVSALAGYVPYGHGGDDYSHGPAHPYSFKYGVNDPHTHDIKDQHEEGHGGVVKGSYSLVEPDGHVRHVEYTADPHNGFNAVVKRNGHVIFPAPAPQAAYY